MPQSPPLLFLLMSMTSSDKPWQEGKLSRISAQTSLKLAIGKFKIWPKLELMWRQSLNGVRYVKVVTLQTNYTEFLCYLDTCTGLLYEKILADTVKWALLVVYCTWQVQHCYGEVFTVRTIDYFFLTKADSEKKCVTNEQSWTQNKSYQSWGGMTKDNFKHNLEREKTYCRRTDLNTQLHHNHACI